jgi:hypothetical protein
MNLLPGIHVFNLRTPASQDGNGVDAWRKTNVIA